MTAALQLLIRSYQKVLSPALHFLGGAGCGCRFEPSCSQYCLDALQIHGALKGILLGVRRLLRCHPWGGAGMDPVPGAARGVRSARSGHPAEETREFKNY